eukprot:Sdes_comp17571_c0_seq2m6814
MKEEHSVDSGDYDIASFFYIHDVDKNGFLDRKELLHILGSSYGNGDYDTLDEQSKKEIETFLETVYREVDLDKDFLISYDEYILSEEKAQQQAAERKYDEQQNFYEEPSEGDFEQNPPSDQTASASSHTSTSRNIPNKFQA